MLITQRQDNFVPKIESYVLIYYRLHPNLSFLVSKNVRIDNVVAVARALLLDLPASVVCQL